MAQQDDDRLIGWQQVRQLVPVSRTTVWSWRRQGNFPKPVRLSPSRVAWRESEVRAWIATRPAA